MNSNIDFAKIRHCFTKSAQGLFHYFQALNSNSFIYAPNIKPSAGVRLCTLVLCNSLTGF